MRFLYENDRKIKDIIIFSIFITPKLYKFEIKILFLNTYNSKAETISLTFKIKV